MSYYLSIKKVNFKYIRVAISISNNSISIHFSTSTSNKKYLSKPQPETKTSNQPTTTNLSNQRTITAPTTLHNQLLFT